MGKVRTAVIGVGYLGQFHAQKYAAQLHSELVAVCDVRESQAKHIAQHYGCAYFTDYAELLAQSVDAVSIAVPTHAHFEVAQACLAAGLHVLLEKPMTSTVAQADTLIALAKQKRRILQIGHLERFNPALRALESRLSLPRFINTERFSPFKLRGTDVSVVLDLMIHDIDIVQSMIASPIARIDAIGASVLSNSTDIANARLCFENGSVANLNASRISEKTTRYLRLFQSNAYFSLDFHTKTLTVRGKQPHQDEAQTGAAGAGLCAALSSDTQSFEDHDPLNEQIMAFIASVRHRTPPVMLPQEARDALGTALAIQTCIDRNTTVSPEQKKEQSWARAQ